MRRSLVVCAVLALVASAFVTEAAAGGKKKRERRTVTAEYLGFSGFRGAYEGSCDAEPVACVSFPIEKGERFVSVEVTDGAGMPVWASVYVYGYTDGHDPHEHVCGASESPLELLKGLDRLVVVMTQTTGGATNPCIGPATAGSVTATFSNLR